jgi:D-alanyl-D-alanine dipeptidase
MKIFCSALLFAAFSYGQRPVADSAFVPLRQYSAAFAYDMKYATADNFLKKPVYDCAECYLRLQTVKALISANDEFLKKGYRIKLFDCYRRCRCSKKCGRSYRTRNT